MKAYDEGDEQVIRERHERVRGTYWMAMALAYTSGVTLSFGDETANVLNRLVKPQAALGGWTAMVAHVLDLGGVFDGWVRHVTPAGEALKQPSGADKLMVVFSRLNNLTLITRDEGVLKRAASDVIAMTPERYAAKPCDLDVARHLFFSRWPVAVGAYLQQWTTTPTERDEAVAALYRATGFLGEIWSTR